MTIQLLLQGKEMQELVTVLHFENVSQSSLDKLDVKDINDGVLIDGMSAINHSWRVGLLKTTFKSGGISYTLELVINGNVNVNDDCLSQWADENGISLEGFTYKIENATCYPIYWGLFF